MNLALTINDAKQAGREEGREEGMTEKAYAVAKKTLLLGLDIQQVAEITGLPVEKVQELKNNQS